MKAPNRLISLAKQTPYICYNCKKTSPFRLTQSLRTYSTSTTNPPSSACVLLKSRRLIHLSGPDSTHYLQGAITANVQPSNPRTSGFYGAFLNAQGRVLNDVFIYPIFQAKSHDSSGLFSNGRLGEDPGWLIEVDADEAERLVKHIKKYKLRAKFGVRVLEEGEADVWFIWNDSPSTSSSAGGISSQSNTTNKTQYQITSPDNRAPNFGQRIILPSTHNLTQVIEKEQDISIPQVDEMTYRIRRYLYGIPEGQKEILRESALVQESNIDYMGGVDYRKGCYVGQELTIRTHHTGVVRKRILPLMLYRDGEEIPEMLEYRGGVGGEGVGEGSSIGRVGRKGRGAGKWLGGVGNLGLGLVRLEVMTGIVIQGEGGGYREGDEFKIDVGEEGSDVLKVKAFVPSWHFNK